MKNIFTALNGLMSIDESNDLTNPIAKLIPEETSMVFSESDYVIDLSSWFQDNITQEKVSDLHKAIKNRKCIYLEYISKRSRRVRIIYPHKLVFKQAYWYLYAFCEDTLIIYYFIKVKIQISNFKCTHVIKLL